MANPTVAQDQEAAAAQPPRAAFNFKAILQQMVQLNASDLHLKVGRPPTLRVNGDPGASVTSEVSCGSRVTRPSSMITVSTTGRFR